MIVHSYVKLPKGGKSTKKEVAGSTESPRNEGQLAPLALWGHFFWTGKKILVAVDQEYWPTNIGQVGLMKQELDWMKLEHHQPTSNFIPMNEQGLLIAESHLNPLNQLIDDWPSPQMAVCKFLWNAKLHKRDGFLTKCWIGVLKSFFSWRMDTVNKEYL